MADVELLPCPFCGKSNQDHWPCEWLDASGANVIRCAWCHGAAPMNVWNRRALAQQPTDPVRALIALAERAVPFLLDEAANYDDDGSNEPLELAREIESVLAELAGLRVTVNKTDTE